MAAAVRRLFIVVPVLGLLAATWLVNAVEGRVTPAQLERTALPIVADQAPPLHSQGQLVAVTGRVTAAPLGDSLFLKPGPYFMIRRDFERYGWMQYPKGERVASAPDGSSTMVEDYDYRLQWSYNLHDSEGFAAKEGHENPEPRLEKASFLAPEATLGRYTFKTSGRSTLEMTAAGEPLKLTPDLIDTSLHQGTLVGDTVYYQDADPNAPKPGDTRISYYVLPQGSEVTLVGTLDGTEIKKQTSGQGSARYSLELGGNLNYLEQATREFAASQWRWRGIAGLLLLSAYWLVGARRLRRSSMRLTALPLAVVLAGGSVAAAMYLEAWPAFGAVIGVALAVGWWGLGAPLDEGTKKP